MTDLVNPRQAYFSRLHPEITPSAARLQAMMAGTGFHELFGRAVSTEEFVEQLVEFKEIVGKIDVFEDAPVELKTTGSMPSDILSERASHAEQLAMYCVMVDKPIGHLLYYKRSAYGRSPGLRAFDLELRDASRIGQEMLRRRDLLRTALETGDGLALPRCEWHGRECAYAQVCHCDTAAPFDRIMSDATVGLRENTELAQRLRETIVARPDEERVRKVTVNDLVFPRKAAYELRGSGKRGDEEGAESRMASFERQGFEGVLKDAVWYGIPGACKRVQAPFGPIRASILLFREIPTLFRNNKRRDMIERHQLGAEVPHYLERLGFECALLGKAKGRLIVYYSAIPDDKFMVYDVWFKGLDEIRAEMERRLALLVAGEPPERLPPCQPAWMSRFCAYAPECGCGSQGRAVQEGLGMNVQ